MELNEQQLQELERLARRHPDAHVRSRAMAVRAVAIGHTRQQTARFYPFSAYSIGQWCRDYELHGDRAFAIEAGRGRRSRVDTQQVLDCLRRSPQQFGLSQTRWSLAALSQACPSLEGMSERGILDVLHRLGFRYKRGQPWIHSPDPLYKVKKTPSKPPTKRLTRSRKKR